MIAAADVCYFKDWAVAAAILFCDWSSERPEVELRQRIEKVEPYEPGNFYRRELPGLMRVLEPVRNQLETIVIDGYVWLGSENRSGLGAHLYEAFGRKIPVIGVAKSAFRSGGNAKLVWRGGSRRPLYVSSVGTHLTVAAKHIESMRGPHRIPTLLKIVDALCRGLGRTLDQG